MRRLELLLGAQPTELGIEHLEALCRSAIRETAQLGYKGQVYGGADSERRDLAGDVAALANSSGGLIVVGIAAVDGAATRMAMVSLTETEELRMYQTIASLVAPVPLVDIRRVGSAADAPKGAYLIRVAPSAA